MTRWKPLDREYMARALSLAARARGRTSPNPMVGALVVKNGSIVGEGYHQGPGFPHAETEALDQAGDLADGSVLYANLEPCCHHGRTPPCTNAIVAAGVSTVVVSMVDPDPRVSGRGVATLRAHGIGVEVGLLRSPACRLNEHYVKHVTTGLPFVIYKYAMTLDGKTATSTGDSRWISSSESRELAHELRASCRAIMIGIGTALADNPRLTVRLATGEASPPWRVVVDTAAKLPPLARVITSSQAAPAVVAAGESAPEHRLAALREAGAMVWVLPETRGRIDLVYLMRRLGGEGLNSVLLEGGGTLAAAMVESHLVDRVVCFLSPRLVGGTVAPTPLAGSGTPFVASALSLTGVKVTRAGPDVVVDGYLPKGRG
ncbi:MAG: bifunctional diaminohydroxyphosphoribosylaminopyrimidine deaminase/5-amino-6-(5-phosphoribosylamino)uracil reductase RibD [bacterium]|nr:bifunctional diaminohydroxyphosphoribosylaminopyrimidine deaminase/5-amino-6-(5-phosphoribosylamino)uracil reductase RibD [bacterium]